jgi:hypothetical protein
MSEFLPCPFCNEMPTISSNNCITDGFVISYMCFCSTCGFSIEEEYDCDLLASWNRRGPHATSTPATKASNPRENWRDELCCATGEDTTRYVIISYDALSERALALYQTDHSTPRFGNQLNPIFS